MGEDIHFFVEKKIEGRWVNMNEAEPDPLGEWDLTRNNTFFRVLAYDSPSSEFPTISRPRGLPSDVSLEIENKAHEIGDEYYHSWLTLAEIMSWPHWDRESHLKGTYKQNCPGVWEALIPALQALDPDPMNVRCVFWFDH